MYRSLVVNLVLLNALVGVAGCSREPEKPPPLIRDEQDDLWGDDKKDKGDPENPVDPNGKDDKKDDQKDGTRRSHTSSGRSGYRPIYIPHNPYMQRSSPRTQSRPSPGPVGRGGFGATGRSVVS